MSGIVGSFLNHRGSGIVGKLGTDGYPLTSAGAGKKMVHEQVVAGGIANDAVTLAKMAGGTDGNVISFDASGDPVAIATGSDGQVLTSTGAGSPPAMEAAAGGGKIVQYTNTTSTTSVNTTSTSDVATNCAGAITPTDDGNKIIVTASMAISTHDNSGNCCRGRMKVYRDIGGAGFSNSIMVGGINTGHCRTETDTQERVQYDWINICFVDSPATTSEVTYKVYCSISSANTMDAGYGSQLQTMLLMETDES